MMLHTATARRPVQIADRLDELEEENRQLRRKIAELTGRNDEWAARRVFNLTDAEARILVLLVRCGRAEHRHLEAAIWDGRRGGVPDDPGCCIRSHVKRLRRKIRPHGIDLETVYSFGFAMSETMRARAAAVLRKVGV